MASTNFQTLPAGYVWAPGTVALKNRDTSKVNLYPIPTTDPDDPLNWSKARKLINYSLVCSYVLWTFVILDIGYTAWGPMIEQLGFSVWLLNAAAATNYAGLAVGCIFFMPFVHKYGRRPLYIFSSAVQLAGCIWQAKVNTNADIIASNLIGGLGGAICETVVQISIADIFFVHNHASANSYYLLWTSVGAFLGPVASGYVVDSMGWRWQWWWCVIFLSIQFVATIFLYEESKYVPKKGVNLAKTNTNNEDLNVKGLSAGLSAVETQEEQSGNITELHIDPNIARKTYWQRMALWTPTEAPVLGHIYQPIVVLTTFPAVAYTALTFGTVLACFAILITVNAIYLLEPPYNFTASGVGLFNLPPFVGVAIGLPVGGWLNDKSIARLARKNQGVYEPEQRLWMAIPAGMTIPAGLLMFGIALSKVSGNRFCACHRADEGQGAHWIVLAVGLAIFGFGFQVCLNIALA